MGAIEEAIDKIIRPHLLVNPQVFVYEPGQDTSGLEKADRELLAISPDDQGWRVKVFVPAHRYMSKSTLDYSNFAEDNRIHAPHLKNTVIEVGPRIVKCPLAIVDYQPDIERTCTDILILLKEEGVYVTDIDKLY